MGDRDETKIIRRPGMITARRLLDFRPRFIADGEKTASPSGLGTTTRYGMALELDCPRHGSDHRLTLWFINPCDGGPPKPGEHRYFYRTETTLSHLTLEPRGSSCATITVEGHWIGYVLDGELIDALTFGGVP